MDAHMSLLAERGALVSMLREIPEENVLDRSGLETRLDEIDSELIDNRSHDPVEASLARLEATIAAAERAELLANDGSLGPLIFVAVGGLWMIFAVLLVLG